MSQRDRQWTTLIIWLVFLIALMIVWDRGLMVTVDFSGLWPLPQAQPIMTDAAQLNEVIAAAQEAKPAIMASIQATIEAEYAWRVPFVLALSALLTLAATICTYFVWRNAGLEAYLAREAVQDAKQKRDNRIKQFIEDLDSDELQDLRTRLGDDAPAQKQR